MDMNEETSNYNKQLHSYGVTENHIDDMKHP